MTAIPTNPVRKFAVILALAGVFAASPALASDADGAMEQLAADYIDALGKLSPIDATIIGDHRQDHLLDDLGASGRTRQLKLLKSFQKRLRELDRSALSRENQVDAGVLGNQLAWDIFDLTRLQEWAWNPMICVDRSGTALYGLMARDFAPIAKRLESAASRLERLPKMLAQGRASLQPERVPKIHAETAIAQNQGVLSIIDQMIVPQLDVLAPDQRKRMDAAIEIARDAIATHQAWLEKDLLPRAAGDFRIGANLFDEKLRYALNSPLSRREIMERAENEYATVREQMYEVAKEVYAKQHPYTIFPDAPDQAFRQVIIRAALEQAYRQLPPRDGIVDLARENLQQASDFVIEKNIVTMPDEPVEIIVMPEFQRGIALAYLDAAGPLDENAKTFYAVAPLPSDWTGEQVESFLREYNLYSIQNLTIHEGVPGHYLQLALGNRHPSALRSVLSSGSFVEGWAVYAERVMIDEGYLDHDPLMHLVNLKWYLRAVTNAIIDHRIHVEDMTEVEAVAFMVDGGFQETSEATAKYSRARLSSTQLSTYFVGSMEFWDIELEARRRAAGDPSLDPPRALPGAYGSPPVKYVRALMLGEPIPE